MSASGTAQAKGEDNTCYITLSSGKFYVYGTGAAGSTMEGDVEVLAEKEAQLQFAGTKGKSELMVILQLRLTLQREMQL